MIFTRSLLVVALAQALSSCVASPSRERLSGWTDGTDRMTPRELAAHDRALDRKLRETERGR